MTNDNEATAGLLIDQPAYLRTMTKDQLRNVRRVLAEMTDHVDADQPELAWILSQALARYALAANHYAQQWYGKAEPSSTDTNRRVQI